MDPKRRKTHKNRRFLEEQARRKKEKSERDKAIRAGMKSSSGKLKE